jgi:hypothetical protein
MRSFGTLATATALLLGGAFKIGGLPGGQPVGYALFGAGLVVLGAWLATEIRNLMRTPPDHEEDR